MTFEVLETIKFGANATTPDVIDFNQIVSSFAAAQLLAAPKLTQEECTCDRDPLGRCPKHGALLVGPTREATLADCLRDCEESNPEPGLMDLERAVYNAKVIGGRA